MTVMQNDCCLGGGEFRRSKTAKILDNTDTERERGDFLHFVKNGTKPTNQNVIFRKLITRAFHSALCVRSALDLAFDIVALAEESEPVVEHLLVLVREIRPIGTALLRLEGRLSESARSVLSSEDFEAIVLVCKIGVSEVRHA